MTNSTNNQRRVQNKSSLANKAIRTVKSAVKQGQKIISKKPHRTSNVQKRSTIGVEVEFFILNKNGRMVNAADKLLDKLKKTNKGLDIVKEAGKNMVEVGCYPDLEGINTLQSLSDNLETLLYTAEEEGLVICPLGTYPGQFNPLMRSDAHYSIEQRAYGRQIYKHAGRCTGLHIHYALPWGLFDFQTKTLKKRIKSKHKQSMVNAYNFLIAVDPALSTFAQSSPFYQGKFIGKDARALVWRGDRDLKFLPSLHGKFPEYGEIPPYQHTGTDIINFTEKMYQGWIDYLLQNGIDKKDIPTYKSKLATNWTTLRISHHGTLEQRSMDINTPLIILALSRVIQNIMRAIQENFIKVYVSDIAIEEPFKYEKKCIYIPPHTYVKTELQRRALFKGLEDDKIFKYCKRLLWLAKQFGSSADVDILEPLERMLSVKRTVSDDIIALAKKLGHKKLNQPLPNDIAAQIALAYSNKLFKEMVLFRELVKRQVNGAK